MEVVLCPFKGFFVCLFLNKSYTCPTRLLVPRGDSVTHVCKYIVNVPKSRIVGSGSILNSDIVKSAAREILVLLFGSKA